MKVPIICLLQLLLILVVVKKTTQRTDIYMKGNLTCVSHWTPKWCARIVLVEKDTFESGTDKIAEFGVVCSKIPWIEYEMKGFQDGDGFYDIFYEMSAIITHSCSGRDLIWKQEHKLNWVPVSKTNVTLVEHFAMSEAFRAKTFFDD
ncbi:hypothetical protein CRE_27716 [Caenorhabditis remanei]|uniref:Uncharacterized protein n=1 Tax=Caenorhabditis remanei TaxID=31234 RepID=E3MKN9_CAERE|nr:hypothetical protein CRE_27716 [Caenorhabditis remanei]